MAAWTVLDPAKEARAVLDEMAKSLLDDPSMPAPAQLQSPPAEVLRTLMAGNAAGQAIGKGNSSEVHACQSDPRFVIRTVRQQDEVEWQRELSRLKRVPALSVITTIFRYERPQFLDAQALADPTRCPSDHRGNPAQVRH